MSSSATVFGCILKFATVLSRKSKTGSEGESKTGSEGESKTGSEGVLQRCRSAVEDVRSAGFLSLCLDGSPSTDDSASKMEWVGDATLALEVRRAIAEMHSDMEEKDMLRLSEACISHKGLAGLYDRLRMYELMPGPAPADVARKGRAMGTLAYELQTIERQGEVEESLLAKRALQLLTYAAIIVTLPGFKTRKPRALPDHVQGNLNRLKRFATARDDVDWTHSSLRGGKDPITHSGTPVCAGAGVAVVFGSRLLPLRAPLRDSGRC